MKKPLTSREQLKIGLAWCVDIYYQSTATAVKNLVGCSIGFIIDKECALSKKKR